MSDLESVSARTQPPQPDLPGAVPDSVLLAGHDVPLGRYTTVRRLLPQRQRRMIGAWCFVDYFGPDEVTGRPGMQVPPHPHTGLQTFTWLVDGEILHRDSLGSHQSIRPGQLNLMTSGHGIAHSEYTPAEHPPMMHGLQLWTALPDGARHGAPGFSHHPTLPVWRTRDLTATVLVGEFDGVRSPAVVHTPLVGVELLAGGADEVRLPVTPAFEHGLLVMARDRSTPTAAEVAGVVLTTGSLLYLGPGRTELTVRAAAGTRLFLLGGEPFDEPLVMWWNFVGRSHEEIAQAREDWAAGRRFGPVVDDPMDRLPAPAMPAVRLKARDRHGTILD